MDINLPTAWERCSAETPLLEAQLLVPASGNSEVVDRDSDSGSISRTKPRIVLSYSVNVPILMYHYVAEQWPSPTDLARHR